jgi:hypothetical protein
VNPGDRVRFTRWQALGWTHEPPARTVVDVRTTNGHLEVTFDGATWGPAQHFEVIP